MTDEQNPQPVIVTLPSSTGTGSGRIETPDGQPDIIVKLIHPLLLIAVRASRVYLQTLLGLITGGLVAPNAIPVKDFSHLVVLSAGLSVAPAVVCIIQNMIELLAKFDQKSPTLAG